MKRLVPLAVCVFFLVSCGPSWRWVKPGGTEAEFSQDRKQCSFEADKATGSISNLDDWVIRGARVFTSCMEAKGYEKVPLN